MWKEGDAFFVVWSIQELLYQHNPILWVCVYERERETCFESWAACVKCGFWPVYMEVYKISNIVVGADLISPKK